MTGLGLLVLRLGLAAVFVGHGANKLFGAFAAPGIGPGGLENTAGFMTALGLEPAFPMAVALAIAEFGGGLLLGVGLLTRWVALAIAISQGVAIWKFHLANGFFLNWTQTPGLGPGYEFSLTLIAGLLCLALAGAGEWSIDGRRALTKETRAAGRARLRNKI